MEQYSALKEALNGEEVAQQTINVPGQVSVFTDTSGNVYWITYETSEDASFGTVRSPQGEVIREFRIPGHF